VELAVLEAVVEQVDDGIELLAEEGDGGGVTLGEQAGVVAPGSDVDGDAGFAGNEEGLVAELLRGSIDLNPGGRLTGPAVAAGEDVDLDAALGEGFGEGDGERGFAGAAGGKVADADDRGTQAADGFGAGAEAALAEPEGEPVERDEGEQEAAAGGVGEVGSGICRARQGRVVSAQGLKPAAALINAIGMTEVTP
jgi:hypothetical protein